MKIAFVNQKGGVGKTTSALNIGSSLAKKGISILLIDFDPQSNLTSGLGIKKIEKTIYDAMSSPSEIMQCIQPSYQHNLSIIPSTPELSGASVELSTLENREFVLRESLSYLEDNFDMILLDCPPSFELLTLNALCAVESIIIPIQCEYYAMEGVAQIIKNFNLVKKTLNKKLYIFGIILTMFDVRTNLSVEVAKEIVDAFGSTVFYTVIPRNVNIAESPSFGQSVITYDKNCIGTKSYLQLTDEIIERWKNKKN